MKGINRLKKHHCAHIRASRRHIALFERITYTYTIADRWRVEDESISCRSEAVMCPSKPPFRALTNQSFSRTPSDRLGYDWSAFHRYHVLRMRSFLISSGHALKCFIGLRPRRRDHGAVCDLARSLSSREIFMPDHYLLSCA